MRQDQLEHAIRTACHLADLIEGVAGEFSPFEELHGFSIDEVDLTTSALPTGWRSRLVKAPSSSRGNPCHRRQNYQMRIRAAGSSHSSSAGPTSNAV